MSFNCLSLITFASKAHHFMCLQVQKLESDVLPMQQANSELSEKTSMLQADKKLLEEEIKRWKARTQVSLETRT